MPNQSSGSPGRGRRTVSFQSLERGRSIRLSRLRLSSLRLTQHGAKANPAAGPRRPGHRGCRSARGEEVRAKAVLLGGRRLPFGCAGGSRGGRGGPGSACTLSFVRSRRRDGRFGGRRRADKSRGIQRLPGRVCCIGPIRRHEPQRPGRRLHPATRSCG
jgi:hypothetical protein